jgi:hypothetical protein
MLAAVAGCSGQASTIREKKPLAGATEAPAPGAPAGTIVLASGAGQAPDGTVKEAPEHPAGKSLGKAEKLKSSENAKPLNLALPQRYLGF